MNRSKQLTKIALLAAILLVVLGWLTVKAEDAAPDEWKAPARAARRKNPVAADEKSIGIGKEAYAKQCLTCHGPAGKGDGDKAGGLEKKPGDLSSQKVQEQSDGAMFWKITEGRKPMPSFEKELSEDDRWNVINYVRTLAAHAPADQKPK